MVPILKKLGISAAMPGNHDFDFGVERLCELAKETSAGHGFPWILSNVRDPHGSLCPFAVDHHVFSTKSFTVGCIGLAGRDFNQHIPAGYIVQDPVLVASELISKLESQYQDIIIIALTHMRMPEDRNLLEKVPQIDLILGGHDHDAMSFGNPTPKIIKSGSDFESFSLIDFSSTTRTVTSSSLVKILKDDPDDLELCDLLQPIQEEIRMTLNRPVFATFAPIDCRSTTVRSGECAIGNFLADMFRLFHHSDIAFCNAGAIRCNSVIDGVVNASDILDMVPFGNKLLVLKLSGQVIKEALENGYSDAMMDGRFLHISGMNVHVDWSRPQNSRVARIVMSKSGADIDMQQTYSLAVPNFIGRGYDGFTMLTGHEFLVNEEIALTESEVFFKVFGGDTVDNDNSSIQSTRKALIINYKDGESLSIINPKIEDRIKSI